MPGYGPETHKNQSIMLNREELEWLKRSANEMNNLLQEISASNYRMEGLSQQVPEIRQYLAITVQSVERASKLTASMLQRVRDAELGMSSDSAPSGKDGFGSLRVVSREHSRHDGSAAGAGLASDGSENPADIAAEMGFTIANPAGPNELVLMVDDENAVLMLAKMMLTDAGYRVIAITDPVKAQHVFSRIHRHVGLVILDFAMPVMDGGELFDEMRMVDPKACVVLSSGFADQAKLSRMLSKGLKGFIPKPYSPEKLLFQIRSVLDLGARRTGG
jgi:CheY-like chemotaxis protein